MELDVAGPRIVAERCIGASVLGAHGSLHRTVFEGKSLHLRRDRGLPVTLTATKTRSWVELKFEKWLPLRAVALLARTAA